MLKIGIVGCGAIASLICKALETERVKKAEVISLYDTNYEKSSEIAKKTNSKSYETLEDFLNSDIDLVVECASVNAVNDVATKSLTSSKDVIIMSVGALVDKDLFIKLHDLAEKNNKKVYVPSGAIAGIDAIKAGSLGHIKSVQLTTTKPVFGLANALLKNGMTEEQISEIQEKGEPTVVFDGTVFEAISKFPQNINVSVVLSLASKVPANVKIVADPSLNTNRHEILVKGSIGTIKTCVENNPCKDNPKTSALAAYSVIRLIKDLSEPLRIGT
ncbi:aspartate dehydrogenase [Methanococcus voltae]|uniref:L-aspartate dehydrogenase n=1 Tax=Methanococcus voltae (strain ATCC BAA-1334 / A3) TaxID=456320 RepID=D7DTX1_METV3|nr:aspartate dehydrogenase [Methanococcus voltae]MCS3900381.1 aspartate dehydrogenase [Methanococcus voltae]